MKTKLIAYKTLETSHRREMGMHSKRREHAGDQTFVQDRDNTQDVSDITHRSTE